MVIKKAPETRAFLLDCYVEKSHNARQPLKRTGKSWACVRSWGKDGIFFNSVRLFVRHSVQPNLQEAPLTGKAIEKRGTVLGAIRFSPVQPLPDKLPVPLESKDGSDFFE